MAIIYSVILITLLLVDCVNCVQLAASSAKQRLIGLVDGAESRGLFPITLVDPCTRNALKLKKRAFGFVEEQFLESEEGMRYSITPEYIDLTLDEAKKPFWEISNRERVSSRFFQNPILSTIYERGYRQNFRNAGFPGPEAESREALSWFEPTGKETVVDLSCGSGFMSRLFSKSGRFGTIVSADLSPNMLQETRRRFLEEELTPSFAVRVDSAKLPFEDNSIDFVHAGAAMHCWPRLPEALAEVHRVLKPKGRFYASTFFALGTQKSEPLAGELAMVACTCLRTRKRSLSFFVTLALSLVQGDAREERGTRLCYSEGYED